MPEPPAVRNRLNQVLAQLGDDAPRRLERRHAILDAIAQGMDALIMPRVSKTYDIVFDLTPEDFDIAFREYAAHRCGHGAH